MASIANRAKVDVNTEQRKNGLYQEQYRGDQSDPKILVFQSYFPVDFHDVYLLLFPPLGQRVESYRNVGLERRLLNSITIRVNIKIVRYFFRCGCSRNVLVDLYGIGGAGKDTAWGNQDFVFTVDAENCTNDMLLRYGAHGESSDDWKCGKVTVTVEVIEEN